MSLPPDRPQSPSSQDIPLQSISLLKKLYNGNFSLKATYGWYWLGLGVLTCFLWCLLWFLLLSPVLLLGESLFDAWLESQTWNEDILKNIERLRPFKWLILLLWVPLSTAPGYTFYHTVFMTWPIWKSLQHEPPTILWGRTAGRIWALLPLGLILLTGLFWGGFWLLISILGGPLSILSKVVFFIAGLIPHGLLAGILFFLKETPTNVPAKDS